MFASVHAQTALSDGPSRTSLEEGFKNPPNSARPRVWWHWMNGNITKDGIRKDLEWMHRVGIGGVQNFDAALETPTIVDRRLPYMSSDWKDAFRYAANTAQSLGLELAIAASPGWSETGAPWVPAQDAMKKLVWSETIVEGGSPITTTLAPVPDVTGPFQTMGRDRGEDAIFGIKVKPPTYSADVAVIAYRVDGSAASLPTPLLRSAKGEPLDAAKVADGDYETALTIERGSPDKPGFIDLEYSAPQTVRSATIFMPGLANTFTPADLRPRIEASDDGTAWRPVADIPLSLAPTTISFAPVTARKFRLVLASADLHPFPMGTPAPGAVISSFAFGPPPKTAKLAELRLSPEARVNAFEMKAGFALTSNYYALGTTTAAADKGVAPSTVIDLTGKMKEDGRLNWTPPPGRWRILRFGYSLVGTMNHPATVEATGLEVDKFDGAALRRYLETYLATYSDFLGNDSIGKRGLRALLSDSIEVGPSNWTPDLLKQFQRLRGYDARPWMPALAGYVIGTRKQTDAFLYDYRRTLSELISTEHYEAIAAIARQHGLTYYAEALEGGRPSLGDDLSTRRHADIPMGALWAYGDETGPRPANIIDMRGAASVAHLYGQNLVGAESLTAAFRPWAFAPADLKPMMDLAFASGVNRPIIHTSVHQPVDDKKPGLSLSMFGQYFSRHEAWGELARPWVDYLSRTSYLLQQGRAVADVAYFYGEEAPLTGLYSDKPVEDAPQRYGYDFVNAEALTSQLKAVKGELVSPSGARYRILKLGGSSDRMSVDMLRRLEQIAAAGVIITGAPPKYSPTLKDDPAEFEALVRKLWHRDRNGKAPIRMEKTEEALKANGISPDFDYSAASGDAEILFAHRRWDGGDAYFLTNRKKKTENIQAMFRVTGKAPEIWHADTGTFEPMSYRIENGRTIVPLEMLPQDAFFVLFRKDADSGHLTFRKPTLRALAPVTAAWTASFQEGRGAPRTIKMDRLLPLNQHTDPSVRYYSGEVVYQTQFVTPPGWKATDGLLLDLGGVADVAAIKVNGQDVGSLWKAPYRVEIGHAVHKSTNSLEVRVATTWVNRLIGDAQPGAKKTTFTTFPTYKPDAPLRPAGLIGPVILMGDDRQGADQSRWMILRRQTRPSLQ
ncbi:glycosyl hydrolase [Novosphingobium sp. Chol11]|uniref:glycosyl hydrolase n=1 Tax=Novosphingobium sp. Chol11 TaxID=1385763 RepID=UPI000BE40389|nr:glycosyl hydrolase [Novosphingobium sp. Chol11]